MPANVVQPSLLFPDVDKSGERAGLTSTFCRHVDLSAVGAVSGLAEAGRIAEGAGIKRDRRSIDIYVRIQ